jgi:hypothetical protein
MVIRGEEIEKYSYWDNIIASIKILGFNDQALERLSTQKKATLYGFITLAIWGLLGSILTLNLMLIISNIIFTMFIPFISYSIYHLIAKFIFVGKATGAEYFRSISNISIIFWLSIIPFLGGIILIIFGGLYIMAVNIFILNKVHKLSWIKAVVLGLLPLIILIFFVILLGFAILTNNPL